MDIPMPLTCIFSDSSCSTSPRPTRHISTHITHLDPSPKHLPYYIIFTTGGGKEHMLPFVSPSRIAFTFDMTRIYYADRRRKWHLVWLGRVWSPVPNTSVEFGRLFTNNLPPSCFCQYPQLDRHTLQEATLHYSTGRSVRLRAVGYLGIIPRFSLHPSFG